MRTADLGARAAFAIALIVVAIVTKAIGCGVLARLAGFDTKASIRVGAGMISRGEVGLIVAGHGLTNGLIDRDVFSASVVMVLVTTMVTPPLLKATFPARRGRKVVIEETVAGPPEESVGPTFRSGRSELAFRPQASATPQRSAFDHDSSHENGDDSHGDG